MIDITTALYNIMHSRYGKDVRQSIHDGIYQINENANEALAKAKTMDVGTAIVSTTSSSAGYTEGNLYLNNSTWDLWKCIGTNLWQNLGCIKGAKGDQGNDSYVHIAYSQYEDGTDFTNEPTTASKYIGIYTGQLSNPPTEKQYYTWSRYVGDMQRMTGVERIENVMDMTIYSSDGKIRISTGSDGGGDVVLAPGTGKVKLEKTDGSQVELVEKNHTHTKTDITDFPTSMPSNDVQAYAKTGSGITVAKSVPSDAKFTDTTYSSKSASSGGTDVSLVTTGDKYTWNNKGTYSKPSGGIPKTDLASAVQSSLTKADNSVPRDYTIKYDDDYGCSFSWKTILDDEDYNPYGGDGIMLWIPYGSSDSDYAHEFFMDDNETVLYHRGVADGSWYRIFDDGYNGNWQTKTTTNTGTITIPTNAKEVYISARFVYSGDYVTFQTNALRSDLVKDKNNRVSLGGYSNGNTDIGSVFVNVSSSGVVSLRGVKYANGNYLSSTTLTVRYRV